MLSTAPACSGSSGSSKWIFSKQGSWGNWRREEACPYGHVLVGARARSERKRRSGTDDTAGCSSLYVFMQNLSGWHSAVGYDKKLLIKGEPVTSSFRMYSNYCPMCLAFINALTTLKYFSTIWARSKHPLPTKVDWGLDLELVGHQVLLRVVPTMCMFG